MLFAKILHVIILQNLQNNDTATNMLIICKRCCCVYFASHFILILAFNSLSRLIFFLIFTYTSRSCSKTIKEKEYGIFLSLKIFHDKTMHKIERSAKNFVCSNKFNQEVNNFGRRYFYEEFVHKFFIKTSLFRQEKLSVFYSKFAMTTFPANIEYEGTAWNLKLVLVIREWMCYLSFIKNLHLRKCISCSNFQCNVLSCGHATFTCLTFEENYHTLETCQNLNSQKRGISLFWLYTRREMRTRQLVWAHYMGRGIIRLIKVILSVAIAGTYIFKMW